MSQVLRSVKNVTKGYSSVQVKVRNGTNAQDNGVGKKHKLTDPSSDEQRPMGSHRDRYGRHCQNHIQQVCPTTSHTGFGETVSSNKYCSSTDFYEVMDMLDKRLNDKGKNWRHVLKSLKVLDYCLHEGSELVVTWARKNIYIIKTLREFIYLDEDSRDVGASSKFTSDGKRSNAVGQ